jgi:hypothetical protein
MGRGAGLRSNVPPDHRIGFEVDEIFRSDARRSKVAAGFLPVLPRNSGFPVSAKRAIIRKRLGLLTPTQLSPARLNN